MGTKTDSAGSGSCAEEEESLASPFHVLAVDDSIVDRNLMERLLKISSYKVTTVESGSRALELLGLKKEPIRVQYETQRLKVNMIITDYSMPGMTGYELLKTIKKSSALKEIPVVVVSSEKVRSRIDRCLEEGAEEFIVKPLKLSDVKRLKVHIVKGLSKKHQQQSTASKRKTTSDNLRNLPKPGLRKRPRVV